MHAFPQNGYENALLVPAFLEDLSFLQRLDSHPPLSEKKFLLVLISNHPSDIATADKGAALASHAAIVDWLGVHSWQSENLSLFELDHFDVLLVDRTGAQAIATDQGVGLARKIGADLITYLISIGHIRSQWILSSDADSLLPKEYFKLQIDPEASAALYPFKHLNDGTNIGRATELYEKSINHYVEGLKSAGSDYAFPSLGSCLAINVKSYIQARGFPKRAAGEDFYLLNKLAKLGPIQLLQMPEIQIEARTSDRVPFGTGPAVAKLIGSPSMYEEPIFYNPKIFELLETLLAQLRLRPKTLDSLMVSEICSEALQHQGIDKAFSHAQNQKLNPVQYDLHIKSWLDGFRTLKFVHYLRDNGYPSLSYNDLSHH